MPEDLNDRLNRYLESQQADGYMFSGPINPSTADELVSVIEHQSDRRQNACLFLTTGGGDPHCAYRIGRALMRSYGEGELRFLLGGYCKSAGTLLVLCGDELIFSTFGELGPLDVQLGKINELVGADSGLDLNQSLEQLATVAFTSFEAQLLKLVGKSQGSISTKVAAEIASDLTTGLFSPIMGQIDPLRLGVSWRSNQIGFRYGERLAGKNVKEGTVDRLVNFYPAHGFVIDEGEAAQLFHRVRHANTAEESLFSELKGVLRVPNDTDRAIILSLRTDLAGEERTNMETEPVTPETAPTIMEGSESHEKPSKVQ